MRKIDVTDRHIGVEEVLNSPEASYWLKDMLRASLRRDPVDAVKDAEVLVAVLQDHLDLVLKAFKDKKGGVK